MARAKKPIVERVLVKKTLALTGMLNLDNLQGFVMEMEEKGEVDVTNLVKKYDGQFATITIGIKEEDFIDQE